jgi:hypothetical protein
MMTNDHQHVLRVASGPGHELGRVGRESVQAIRVTANALPGFVIASTFFFAGNVRI